MIRISIPARKPAVPPPLNPSECATWRVAHIRTTPAASRSATAARAAHASHRSVRSLMRPVSHDDRPAIVTKRLSDESPRGALDSGPMNLRQVQEPLKEGYRRDPDTGRITLT